jgi:hypothetical protein
MQTKPVTTHNAKRYAAIAACARDEQGAITIFMAIGVVLLIAFIFFAYDTGMNYGNQSELTSKVSMCSKYPAKEFAWLYTRVQAGSTKTDWPNTLFPNAAAYSGFKGNPNGLMVAVSGQLSARINACLNSATVGFRPMAHQVDKLELKTQSPGQWVMHVSASIAQSERSNYNNPNGYANKRTKITAGVLFPMGDCPSSGCPDTTTTTSTTEAANVIFSLNKSSVDNMGPHLVTMMTSVNDLLTNAHLIAPQIQWAMMRGNIPTEFTENGSDRYCDRKSGEAMGWTGGCYDNTSDIPTFDLNTKPQIDASRKVWPFYGSFYAQKTRTCEADAVWTYRNRNAGECYAIGTGSCEDDSPGCHNNDADYDGGPVVVTDSWKCPNGCNTQGSRCTVPVGAPPGTSCPNEAEHIFSESYGTAKKHDIVVGQWFASCPKGGAAYRDATKFTTFSAHRVFKAIGLASPEVTTLSMKLVDIGGVNGVQGGDTEGGDLKPLVKKNTENSWPWACLSTDPGLFPNGAYGAPYGEKFGSPLVDHAPGFPDSALARGLNCLVPDPGSDSVKLFHFGLIPEHCRGTGKPIRECDIAEGGFQMALNVSGLKGKNSPTGPAQPPMSGGQPRIDPPGGGGWAWAAPGIINVNGPLPIHSVGGKQYPICPRANFRPRVAPYIAAPGGEIVVDSIPAEEFDLSIVNIEKGLLPPDGSPQISKFDDFNYLYSSAEQPYVRTSMQTKPMCGVYPNFCRTSGVPPEMDPQNMLVEDTFWDCGQSHGSSCGVAHFSGEKGAAAMKLGINGIKPGGNPDSDPCEGSGSFCQEGFDIVNVNTVKGSNNLALPNFWFGANNLQRIIAELEKGYKDLPIYHSLEGNQAALLKAGARAVINYANKSGGKTNKMLIFIGSCPPPGSFNGSAYKWKGPQWHGKWNFFANSNNPGPGRLPGVHNTSDLRLTRMNSLNDATNIRNETLTAFQNVGTQLDSFMVITGQGCDDFARVSTGGNNTTPGVNTPPAAPTNNDSFCLPGCTIINEATSKDCAANFVCKTIIEKAPYRETSGNFSLFHTSGE